jgi:predicted transcriptional regulator
MAKRISEEQKQKIRELVAEGDKTQKEIAEEVGCSVVAVKKYGYEEEPEESEELQGEASEQVSGTSVEEFYEKIIDAKDDHIKSVERLSEMLIGLLAGKSPVIIKPE